VLVGPSHFVPFRGLALPEAGAFATPLGEVPLDSGASARLAALASIPYLNAVHAREHSLEVELPFLQVVLGAFELVPLAVGDASVDEVARALEASWGGGDTLVVASSDLSHYHPYAAACALDRRTAERIEALEPVLGPEDACGCRAVNGLLLAARRRGLAAERLDLRNSGDTAGGRGEVVGYGAWAFGGTPP
jgi:AmmeMemoRadiSam system protein B